MKVYVTNESKEKLTDEMIQSLEEKGEVEIIEVEIKEKPQGEKVVVVGGCGMGGRVASEVIEALSKGVICVATSTLQETKAKPLSELVQMLEKDFVRDICLEDYIPTNKDSFKHHRPKNSFNKQFQKNNRMNQRKSFNRRRR